MRSFDWPGPPHELILATCDATAVRYKLQDHAAAQAQAAVEP